MLFISPAITANLKTFCFGISACCGVDYGAARCRLPPQSSCSAPGRAPAMQGPDLPLPPTLAMERCPQCQEMMLRHRAGSKTVTAPPGGTGSCRKGDPGALHSSTESASWVLLLAMQLCTSSQSHVMPRSCKHNLQKAVCFQSCGGLLRVRAALMPEQEQLHQPHWLLIHESLLLCSKSQVHQQHHIHTQHPIPGHGCCRAPAQHQAHTPSSRGGQGLLQRSLLCS